MHCGGCVARIERRLAQEPDLSLGRVNLTTRRLTLRWRGSAARAAGLATLVTELGYRVAPFDPERLRATDDRTERELLRCVGVAGFAASNVMLLAVAVWAGHFTGMGDATRTLLHWFEALIALPAIAYAGRPFFRSAVAALRTRRTNMDVPISVAVILVPAMSLAETMRGGVHAYFDSAVALLFFLLIGRYLDRRARGSARSAVERMVAVAAASVNLVLPDGTLRAIRPERLEAGQEILVATGERIGADGAVSSGSGAVDTSLITGESAPQPIRQGDRVFAGTINLGPPLHVRIRAVGEGTLLAEIVRLMELAEQRRSRFVALADRIARAYAPVVHTLALFTFLGWTLTGGASWQQALLYAVAVLIITCPCALGLAVPVVQVVASGRLMRRGILLKSATALERFGGADMVVLDKTGTLTEGRPTLLPGPTGEDLRAAASLARASRHPLARALAAAAPEAPLARGAEEVAGFGIRCVTAAGEWRLGRRDWATGAADESGAGAELWLSRPGSSPVRFVFEDALRKDSATVVAELRHRGYVLALLSGDRAATVAAVARQVGIDEWHARCTPAEKTARLEAWAAAGRRVLMVGDGLNDAPALAAAFVSLSPATAVDITQTAADAVFQGDRLQPVVEVLEVARRSGHLVTENFVLSFVYNVLAVPFAIMGYVTPLIAALAMSGSSLLVIVNSMRLDLRRTRAG